MSVERAQQLLDEIVDTASARDMSMPELLTVCSTLSCRCMIGSGAESLDTWIDYLRKVWDANRRIDES